MLDNVAIIGSGNIGSTLNKILGGRSFTIGKDKNADIEISSLDGISSLFKQEKVSSVINAGPYYICEQVALEADRVGVNYLDLTEDNIECRKIQKIAAKSKSGSIFIPKCGLAPGAINIMAKHLYDQFDTVETLKLYVGALPQNSTNYLRYSVNWSIDGLINEYLQSCVSVQNNNIVAIKPLDDYEKIIISGKEYEAFNTSGGLGTLPESIYPANMSYKSIRYCGHCDQVTALIEAFSSNFEKIKQEFLENCPPCDDDIVLMHVSAVGEIYGKRQEKNITKEIHPNTFTAIQWTTACGVLGVLQLIEKGDFKNNFIRNEDLNTHDFFKTQYGKIFA